MTFWTFQFPMQWLSLYICIDDDYYCILFLSVFFAVEDQFILCKKQEYPDKHADFRRFSYILGIHSQIKPYRAHHTLAEIEFANLSGNGIQTIHQMIKMYDSYYNIVKTQISKLVRTTHFWNNLRQECSNPKYLKPN